MSFFKKLGLWGLCFLQLGSLRATEAEDFFIKTLKELMDKERLNPGPYSSTILDKKHEHANTKLHITCEIGSMKVVEQLLVSHYERHLLRSYEAGFFLNEKQKSPLITLLESVKHQPNEGVTPELWLEILKLLMSDPVQKQYNGTPDAEGIFPFTRILALPHEAEIKLSTHAKYCVHDLFQAALEYSDAQPEAQRALLHARLLSACASSGKISFMCALLARGCDPNVPNPREGLPVFIAATQGHFDAMQLLLDAGAQPQAPHTNLLFCILEGSFHAIGCLNPEATQKAFVLVAKKFPEMLLEKDSQGQTLFHRLVFYLYGNPGHPERKDTVKALLQFMLEAHPDALPFLKSHQDSSGRTALEDEEMLRNFFRRSYPEWSQTIQDFEKSLQN